MRVFKVLSLALLLGATSLSTGCILRTRGTVGYTVYSEPPPPRHVYVDARPGYVWIDGYWYWTGGDWVWADGYWETERPGYVYVQGRYVVRGGRHVYQPGVWRAHGRSNVHVHGNVNVQGRGRGRVVHEDRGGRDHRDHDSGRRHHKRGKRDHRGD